MEKLTNDFLEKLGARVKSIREKRKLTLNDMEFSTGIDLSDYNKIEKGKTNITFKTFLKIAKGLKINPSDLINFEFDITKYVNEN
jgi:transcriptional regulator with XRE-family HTH domain